MTNTAAVAAVADLSSGDYWEFIVLEQSVKPEYDGESPYMASAAIMSGLDYIYVRAAR